MILTLFRGFIALGRAISRAISTGRTATRRAVSRRAGRLRGSASGLGQELVEEVLEAISLLQEAQEILTDGYYQAITTMASMPGNAGQQTVFLDYVIPAFEEAFTEVDPLDGWPDVDIGDYMVFMGEIVEVGNEIMASTYRDAADLIDDAESVL